MSATNRSRSSTHRHPKDAQNNNSKLGLYLLPFVTSAVVMVVGGLWASYWTWGFSWLAILTPTQIAAIAGVACVLMLPSVSSAFAGLLHAARQWVGAEKSRSVRYSLALLASAALFCLFYFLRSRALIYGDGYLFLGSVSPGGELELIDQNKLQALSLILIRSLVGFLNRTWSIEAVNSLAMFNAVGGVVGFWAIYRIAGALTKDWDRRLFLIAVSLTSATIVLFFGYIENYTWASSVCLWTLYYTMIYAERLQPLWKPLVLSMVGIAYHAITLPAAILVLAAWSVRRSESKVWFGFLSYTQMLWALVIGSFVFVALSQAINLFAMLGLSHPFAPIWPEAANHYLAFSGAHLIDVINLILLVAPLGIMLTLSILVSNKTETGEPDEKLQLVGLFALLSGLVSFWIDPELGAPRDWDLLSFFGIPFSIWAAHRFTTRTSHGECVKVMILPALIVALVGVGPNLYEKTHPEIALERLDHLLWQAPQYQKDYDDADRCVSWATVIMDQLKRDDLALKFINRRLEASPNSGSAWFNLGQIHQTRGDVDSSLACFDKAVQCDSDNPRYLLKLVGAQHRKGRFAEALPFAAECAQLDPANPTAHTSLGITLYRLGREAEGLARFKEAFRLSNGGVEEASNLGAAYFGLRQDDSARIYLSRAVQLGSREPRVYESLILAHLVGGNVSEADAVLTRYRTINPQAPNLDHYRKQLTASPKQ